MRAVLCTRFGEPEDLVLTQVPEPVCGPGDLLVRVRGSGLNFADLVFLQGKYQSQPQPPFVPGLEVAGEVIGCGQDVAGFRAGDRVIGQVPSGGFAEYVLMSPATAVRLSVDMPDAEAAGFYANYGTAYSALVQRARSVEGEPVLVLGAAGGVGLAAVQIAKALGLRVIADCRGRAKQDLALSQGAAAVVDHTTAEFPERVKDLTGGKGCAVVIDMIGGEATRAALKTLSPCGRLVIVGFAGGAPYAIPANHLLVKNACVIGHWWGDFGARDRTSLEACFANLFGLYEKGAVRTVLSDVLPLERVPEGLRRYADRSVLSKLVAVP